MTKAPKDFENWVYYDPESPTGLRWRPGQKWRKADAVAGNVNPNSGYAMLCVKAGGSQAVYQCHKIVYYLHTNIWAEDSQLNHINRVRNDNKIENLEYIEGDKRTIQSIQKIDRKNLGELPRYVSWNKRDKRYQGSVRKDGKRVSLGYSKCINTLHKRAVDFVNITYNRNFEYECVDNCHFCVKCPHTGEV